MKTLSPQTKPAEGAQSADRLSHYRTAIASIACAAFKAGDCVSVKYDGRHGGTHWFLCNGVTAYAEHQLHSFQF